MKKIILVLLLCSISNVNAGIYKCGSGGQVSYQSSPCVKEKDENKFSLKHDLSKEQIQAAIDKKAAKLAAENEEKRLDKIAYDKERMIRAEEHKARANYENAKANLLNARETRFQTNAMYERNRIEALKKLY